MKRSGMFFTEVQKTLLLCTSLCTSVLEMQLQDTNIMSILSKFTSFQRLSRVQLRQQVIIEKAIFSLSYTCTCLHTSDLASALWLLHVVFRENQMPILLLETLLPQFNMSIFNNIKGCVRYISASLFCMSKREYHRNKEKCFLFHFESSSRS